MLANASPRRRGGDGRRARLDGVDAAKNRQDLDVMFGDWGNAGISPVAAEATIAKSIREAWGLNAQTEMDCGDRVLGRDPDACDRHERGFGRSSPYSSAAAAAA